jgi:hypothetical protein
MSADEKKPRQTFDQEFIDGAVKLVTQEGCRVAAEVKAVGIRTRSFEGQRAYRLRTDLRRNPQN